MVYVLDVRFMCLFSCCWWWWLVCCGLLLLQAGCCLFVAGLAGSGVRSLFMYRFDCCLCCLGRLVILVMILTWVVWLLVLWFGFVVLWGGAGIVVVGVFRCSVLIFVFVWIWVWCWLGGLVLVLGWYLLPLGVLVYGLGCLAGLVFVFCYDLVVCIWWYFRVS